MRRKRMNAMKRNGKLWICESDVRGELHPVCATNNNGIYYCTSGGALVASQEEQLSNSQAHITQTLRMRELVSCQLVTKEHIIAPFVTSPTKSSTNPFKTTASSPTPPGTGNSPCSVNLVAHYSFTLAHKSIIHLTLSNLDHSTSWHPESMASLGCLKAISTADQLIDRRGKCHWEGCEFYCKHSSSPLWRAWSWQDAHTPACRYHKSSN